MDEDHATQCPAGLATDLKACDAYKNGESAAAKIACPHQVILASGDRMTPRTAGMKLVEHLAAPEFHLIKNSGHMIPLEVPDECRQGNGVILFGPSGTGKDHLLVALGRQP